jgi:hypothetical protein
VLQGKPYFNHTRLKFSKHRHFYGAGKPAGGADWRATEGQTWLFRELVFWRWRSLRSP